MKNLKDFILEGKKWSTYASVSDFYLWACANEMPSGKADVSIINPKDIEGLIDNGWCDNFEGSTPEAAKKAAEWFKKNWDTTVKVQSVETPNDWEISFTLDGENFVAGFTDEFGTLDNRD